ncbi:hypothetical protein Pint_21535 [Pistacia integerrima]|uniref:Uncharacterized protein n=1 Tax=Pistacia integerrima TaxID=434235 RepID=A0ACC0XD24_9ROSI|nr:hypothetical protein Pint_21535 [Pistacia integerrima]
MSPIGPHYCSGSPPLSASTRPLARRYSLLAHWISVAPKGACCHNIVSKPWPGFSTVVLLIMSRLTSKTSRFMLHTIGFDNIKIGDGATLLEGQPKGGVYELPVSHLASRPSVFTSTKMSSCAWHHRLGHPSESIQRHIVSKFGLPLDSSSSKHYHFVPCPQGFLLSQRRCIADLLARTKMTDAHRVATPLATAPILTLRPRDNTYRPFQPETLLSVVRRLQYLSLARPNTAYVVNKQFQYMHRPTTEHWNAAKRLL